MFWCFAVYYVEFSIYSWASAFSYLCHVSHAPLMPPSSCCSCVHIMKINFRFLLCMSLTPLAQQHQRGHAQHRIKPSLASLEIFAERLPWRIYTWADNFFSSSPSRLIKKAHKPDFFLIKWTLTSPDRSLMESNGVCAALGNGEKCRGAYLLHSLLSSSVSNVNMPVGEGLSTGHLVQSHHSWGVQHTS